MKSTILRILRAVSTVLVALVLVLAFLLVGARLFGLQIYTILSPSMEPHYPTGSIIYVKKVDTADLDVKDVITFRLTDDMTATHRIIELVPSPDDPSVTLFRTQGDSNDIPDGKPVHPDDVLGSPVLAIPLLGYLAIYIQSPPGSTVAITVAVCILLFVVLVDILSDDKGEKKRRQDSKQGETPS